MIRFTKLAGYLLVLVVVLSVVEASSYIAGRILQTKWAMWKVPQEITNPEYRISYADYLSRRDPVLGWPYPDQVGTRYESNGTTPNPFYPPGSDWRSCISLYGDSFTEGGGDVSGHEFRWGNVLSEKIQCYVANYGVGGYGTDQAYLRYLNNRNDLSPVVIFGVHTSDVTRNLTRIRDLETPERWFALKPRFTLAHDGTLNYIPIPDLSEEEYLRAIGAAGPLLPLEHESLQPGGPAGVTRLQFPYSLSVLRNVRNFQGFRSRIARHTDWMEFLEPGHALQGLELTVGITKAFVEEARKRGSTPVVLILPHPTELLYQRRAGEWPYSALVEELEGLGVYFSDFGPHLDSVARSRGKELTEYFGATHHYNDAGNSVLADFVYDFLVAHNLL